ncbi:MAG: HAD-IC family P-type ATPase [Lachnospiraceae bacterium]
MKFQIKHEMKGRIRVHFMQKRMTYTQADLLQYYLESLDGVTAVKVYDRTADAAIQYQGARTDLLKALQRFHYEAVQAPSAVLTNSGRELNSRYQEKLVNKVLFHYGRGLILPAPVNACYTALMSVKYIWKGIQTLWHRKIEVPVLDATAIGVSVARGDMGTAGSIMFLLGIGELLEEWTHKKSVGDLARTMSLNVGSVWVKKDGQELLVSCDQVQAGDEVVVHMGTVIPFDGTVTAGEAMVNQASLTGESVPVRKGEGSTAYAGTAVEEGEITVLVKSVGGSSRYEKIVKMIEESEKLKSGLESKAEHLADRLVPYTLAGTGLTYLITRNTTKALAVLMVDFSCALKLAMPISVLSAIREANTHKMTVKGGKYLESVADAKTIVFDKTGTLTEAKPTVADVVSFNGMSPDELLRIAACLESISRTQWRRPSSMRQKSVIWIMRKCIPRCSISSHMAFPRRSMEKRRLLEAIIFVFEDEQCTIPTGMEERFAALPEEYSHLYLALEGQLAAVICIEDPLRTEAAEVVKQLKECGFEKIVMMTGDSDRTAKAIARKGRCR